MSEAEIEELVLKLNQIEVRTDSHSHKAIDCKQAARSDTLFGVLVHAFNQALMIRVLFYEMSGCQVWRIQAQERPHLPRLH